VIWPKSIYIHMYVCAIVGTLSCGCGITDRKGAAGGLRIPWTTLFDYFFLLFGQLFCWTFYAWTRSLCGLSMTAQLSMCQLFNLLHASRQSN